MVANGAVGVATLGAVSVGEHLLGSTWRNLDELLVRDPSILDNAAPGRMAINSAFVFIFLGVALIVPKDFIFCALLL